MKKLKMFTILGVICACFAISLTPNVHLVSASEYIPEAPTKASILIDMDSNQILHDQNAYDHMPVASIVKLMTIMLVFEEIDAGNISLNDNVTVSENASSMGGSQIFLDANCEYNLGELLKSVIVCSANDSSVALAEFIAGSEEQFVARMNSKLKEMNLANTNYENCTGLPSDNQYSCAYDVSQILRVVLTYNKYHEYSSIWLEEFKHPSGRTTEMTNTNRLSRFYQGCIGGKTGSTNEAGYCLAVGAERNSLRLIAVTLGADTTKNRFKSASDLLNYGFANYESYKVDTSNLVNIVLKDGSTLDTSIQGNCSILTKKGVTPEYSISTYLPNKITECEAGQEIGHIDIIVNNQIYSTLTVVSNQTVEQPSFIDNLKDITEDFIN